MSKTFKLQVVAPDKPAISADATLVVLPGEVGEFGVMAQHMSLLSALKPGTMRIVGEQKRELFFIAGGFAEVHGNSVTVLAEEYEPAGEIDAAQAEKDRKHALDSLAQPQDAAATLASRGLLARAEARLKAIEEFKTSK